ncbi:MAG: hypothetical protein A3I04_02565 [Nitrospinae bacterium RIFCSPLOWO2_02_FULL_39_110]|nr:MAG: hypothetical protein A2W53_01775 [Nitrospinae bacterium RIFCSPHIGHO2_02_39_11]OGV98750.1 MAG: hypothetical protein A3D97_05515 [Nitrospinae bacterium RIFCSPHIGHO2_12_FULL_39_42]OGW00179.1 MAG: hypothetical protein A3D20_07020 [Nitrospinae bacterium RIFCSPHIGHO2_02_FULL_39_82]OGW04347.1 MAG: hypothetical protein A3I04_02565 [Nitrospinae bacterium RIFCSPLOWO2_02_FULL_39_110]OGW07135.1 MAG: hypothetical protein A2Z59_09125 [Nitrospinae bacterium RIFCSPLOWO2_02_39_17]OGW09496.1 MAG: hypoth
MGIIDRLNNLFATPPPDEDTRKRASVECLFYLLMIAYEVVHRGDSRFNDDARDFDNVIQYKLENEDVGAYVVIKGDRVTAHRGIHSNPTLTLIFRDIDAAYGLLTMQDTQFDALVFGRLKYEGRLPSLFRFGYLSNYLQDEYLLPLNNKR